MDYSRIEELLVKYWDCESTIEEEQELKTLLQDPSVPEKYRKEAALFGYFVEEKKFGQLGEFFDNRILEEMTAQGSMNAVDTMQKDSSVKRMWQDIAKVAAVVLILVSAVFLAREQYRDNSDNKEIAEAKAAFEETKKALLMLSHSMNKGTAQAGKIAIFNEAQDIIKNESEETPDTENE